MKKILFITGPMGGHGGEETVLTRVIDGLAYKYDLQLLVSSQTGDSAWLTDVSSFLSKTTILSNNISVIKKFVRIFKIIQHSNADIIIALSPRMLEIAYLARLFMTKRTKLISWLHFSVTDKYSRRTLMHLKHADDNFVLTNGSKQQLVESNIEIDSEKIFVTYNPIVRQDKVLPKTASSRPTKIVCVSRIQFRGEKNLQELFDACSNLTGNWELHMYGSDDSKGKIETSKCFKYIKQLDIQSHVIWHGFIKDVWNQIDSIDCLVLTSRYEGFAMVLCEAISYGVPVISSDCPTGPAEIVTSENGFLYQMGDIQQLTKYLQSFVSREMYFNQKVVKESISNFYQDNYLQRFEARLSKSNGR